MESNNDVYQLLEVIKSKDGKNNLYEHLQKLYEAKIEMNDDKKFLDLLEDISIRIKVEGKYFNEDKGRESILKYLEEFNKNSKAKRNLLGPISRVDDPSEIITQVPYVPDYHNLFQTFEWAGISISEKESYLLTNSLRNLAFKKDLKNGVSLWGKIYGTEKDYYIAEADGIDSGKQIKINIKILTIDKTDELPPDFEKRNEDGVNKNTYYVTNDLTMDWIELPDVKPSQLKAARRIRYIFSGNLNRLIITNPHFPGSEKEYLRCQIARITHGTKIEPSTNNWKVADTDNPFKPLEKNEDDDIKKLQANDLISLKNWIHFPPAILKQGRVSHYFEIPEEIENQDEYKNKLIEKDPYDTRIKSISDDDSLLSSIPNIKLPAWKLQYVYDDKVYMNPFFVPSEDKKPEDYTTSYMMVCIRSLRWPGSFTMNFKNQNHFLYFGWGQKFADYSMGEKFVYQEFPYIPKDIGENEEYPEPNSPPHEEQNDAKNDAVDDNKGDEQSDEE